jgi:UDPglucose 6-dehydrogenase
MNLTIFGTGYVGLVTGTCFAEMGNNVTCVDIDEDKINQLIKGEVPIFEPGLKELIQSNCKQNRLNFTTSSSDGIKNSNIYVIAVGTPMSENGEANLEHVFDVAKLIGENITQTAIVINKSTVPVGTAKKVNQIILDVLKKRNINCDFHVVSNPEFLKEGDAIRDFMYPDRIIIGTDNKDAERVMRELYSSFSMKNDRLLFMGVKEAELTKYAANAMLATKISFINEIAALCDKLDVDVDEVRRGIGSDKRIGYSFIYAGCGYGGSCFPKDVKALIYTSTTVGIDPVVLKSVEVRNEIQKELMVNQIIEKFGNDLSGLKFAVWGLSFKPGTNDIREAPSLVIIEKLINAGAIVYAHDPVSISEVKKKFQTAWRDKLFLSEDDQYSILDDSDALLLITEWKMYRNPDFNRIKKLLKNPSIFDGRNQYSPQQLRGLGFTYKGIGR